MNKSLIIKNSVVTEDTLTLSINISSSQYEAFFISNHPNFSGVTSIGKFTPNGLIPLRIDFPTYGGLGESVNHNGTGWDYTPRELRIYRKVGDHTDVNYYLDNETPLRTLNNFGTIEERWVWDHDIIVFSYFTKTPNAAFRRTVRVNGISRFDRISLDSYPAPRITSGGVKIPFTGNDFYIHKDESLHISIDNHTIGSTKHVPYGFMVNHQSYEAEPTDGYFNPDLVTEINGNSHTFPAGTRPLYITPIVGFETITVNIEHSVNASYLNSISGFSETGKVHQDWELRNIPRTITRGSTNYEFSHITLVDTKGEAVNKNVESITDNNLSIRLNQIWDKEIGYRKIKINYRTADVEIISAPANHLNDTKIKITYSLSESGKYVGTMSGSTEFDLNHSSVGGQLQADDLSGVHLGDNWFTGASMDLNKSLGNRYIIKPNPRKPSISFVDKSKVSIYLEVNRGDSPINIKLSNPLEYIEFEEIKHSGMSARVGYFLGSRDGTNYFLLDDSGDGQIELKKKNELGNWVDFNNSEIAQIGVGLDWETSNKSLDWNITPSNIIRLRGAGHNDPVTPDKYVKMGDNSDGTKYTYLFIKVKSGTVYAIKFKPMTDL